MNFSEGELLFIIIIGIILFVSVVCNVTVVVVVVLTSQLRNLTNVLICNLAVSDLLLASLVLPQNLHDISHARKSYHEGDILCRVVYTCPLLCIMASIYSMVAISFERTHAIVFNLNKNLTLRTAAVELAIIWILSFVFCIPTMMEHSTFIVDGTNGTVVGCGSNGVSRVFSVINGVALLMLAYVIPLAILLFNYGRIFTFFRSKGVFGKKASQRGMVFKAMFRTRMTVVKMLILVAAIFAVSWAPYFALLLREKVSGTSDTGNSNDWGNMLRITLSAFSTVYNFGLYVAYNRNFRLGLARLMGYPALARCCSNQVNPPDNGDDVECVVIQHFSP